MYQPPLRPLGYIAGQPYPAVNGHPAQPYGAPPPPIGFVYPNSDQPPDNNPVPADYPPQMPDQQNPEQPLSPEGNGVDLTDPESPEDIPEPYSLLPDITNRAPEITQESPYYFTAPQPAPENVAEQQPQPLAQDYAPLYHKNMPVSFEQNPAVKKLREDKFRAQLGKWIMVHHIPIWAEKQLMVHMQQELARKERMKKYTELSCANVFRPWRWCRMWRARHVRCKGDIRFPRKDDIPKSQLLHEHEDEDTNDEEVQLTEDLINEIMEEETPESTEVIFYEKNGLQGISEWTQLSALLERNKFFKKAMVRENQIRSFALAHQKPTDFLPGDSRLNTEERLNYAARNKMTTFDCKRILHVQEVQMLDHQPNSTDPIKKQKQRRSQREKKRKKQASLRQ